MGVDTSIVPIPLFWVDVPTVSEGIWFHTKASRVKVDKEVELAEELRPVGLPAGKELQGGEIFKILVIGHDIDGRGRALKIVMPVLECLKDGEQLLIMGIIVELQQGKRTGVEGDQTEFTIGATNGEDTSNGIVQSVSLHNQWSIRNPMGKDRGCHKGGFEAEQHSAVKSQGASL